MLARVHTGSRRKRQAVPPELEDQVPELPPEENCATVIKEEAECASEMEAGEGNQQDEAYVVVVKEEVNVEEQETEYREPEEPQYPAYDHNQPFFLHSPPEVKIEYDEVHDEEVHDEEVHDEEIHDEEVHDEEVHDEGVNDEDINYEEDYAAEDHSSQTQDEIAWNADGENQHADAEDMIDTLVSSEEPTERWICGAAPDEERLMELMLAPPPPLPFPLPFYFDDQLIRCKYCSFSAALENACIRHYRQKHGPRYIYCFACGSTFSQQACLYKHEMKGRCRAPGIEIIRRLRMELKARRLRSLCGLTLKVKKSSATVCSQCGVECDSAKKLIDHERRVHTHFRRFHCEYCPAAYTQHNSLKSHLQTHSKEPSICDYCGKSFIKRDSLILHIRNHQGKRFECAYCPKQFTQNRSLVAHEARHTGAPPPHPCQFCSSGFWRLAFLKTHMEKVHGYSIITRKKFLDMMPRMTSEQIEASVEGDGMATFDSTPHQYTSYQVDVTTLSVAELHPGSEESPGLEKHEVKKKSPGAKKSPGVKKSPGIKKSREIKKSLEVKESSEVEKSSGVEKSPNVEKSFEVKESPEVKKSSGVEKSPEVEKSRALTDGKSPTPKKPKFIVLNTKCFKRSTS